MNNAYVKPAFQTWLAGVLLFLFTALSAGTAYAQPDRTVSGTVTDETGLTVIGAAVQVPGTSIGAITDIDGKFSLDVPSGTEQLTVSCVGFVTENVNITSDLLSIVLKTDTQLLEEVVVVGYGTTRKSDLTGSVSTVRADEFNTGSVIPWNSLSTGKCPESR